MFRKEVIIVLGLAGAVFLLITLTALGVGRIMQKTASMMALDDVPSLVNAGAAIFHIQENWGYVNQLPDTGAASNRLALIQQIRRNSPEEHWLNYRGTVYTHEEAGLYNQTMIARSNYTRLREDFFAEIQAGRLAEARASLKLTLRPNYEHYKQAAVRLFETDTKLGLSRAAQSIWYSRAFTLLFIAFGLLVFATGFLVALRLVLTGRYSISPSRYDKS